VPCIRSATRRKRAWSFHRLRLRDPRAYNYSESELRSVTRGSLPRSVIPIRDERRESQRRVWLGIVRAGRDGHGDVREDVSLAAVSNRGRRETAASPRAVRNGRPRSDARRGPGRDRCPLMCERRAGARHAETRSRPRAWLLDPAGTRTPAPTPKAGWRANLLVPQCYRRP